MISLLLGLIITMASADRVRPARIDEIQSNNPELIWSMGADIKEFDKEPSFYGELHTFLISHELDLTGCFTALTHKTLNMPKADLVVTTVLKSNSNLSVARVVSVKPKQTSENERNLTACMKKALTDKTANASLKWLKSKANMPVTFTFRYAMPYDLDGERK